MKNKGTPTSMDGIYSHVSLGDKSGATLKYEFKVKKSSLWPFS